MVDHRTSNERNIDQALDGLEDWLWSVPEEAWVSYVLGGTADQTRTYKHLNYANGLEPWLEATAEARRARVAELSAWLHLIGNDRPGARRLFDAFPETHRPSATLAALLEAVEGRPAEALEKAGAISPAHQASARRIASFALCALGHVEEAVERSGDDEGAMFAAVAAAHHGGAFEVACRVGEIGFERHKTPRFAYNLACSNARAGDPTTALRWLNRAIDAGWSKGGDIDRDDDLASVRALGGYPQVRRRLSTPPYR